MTTSPPNLPTTIGALKASGWVSRSIREEMRLNLESRLVEGRPLTGTVLGYEDTVLPQLETAILAGHDVILLGERGQAKTRIIRSLVDLLDEWLPVVAGSDVRDDPFAMADRRTDRSAACLWRSSSDRSSRTAATTDAGGARMQEGHCQ